MSKMSGAMQLLIYFVLLIFGGITAITTNVIGAIVTITDPFTSFVMVAVSFLVFFAVIPYMIWFTATKDEQ